MLFEINGYWKSDNVEFEDRIVSSEYDSTGEIMDDMVFYLGLDETKIKESINNKGVNPDDLAFVITSYKVIEESPKTKKYREDLFSKVQFETSFNFADLYNCMDSEEQEAIDNLSINQLELFIDNNSHAIRKGFEAGILGDWATVGETIVSNLEIK